jgi:branched-chain amino acid transport system ATP-binding protein
VRGGRDALLEVAELRKSFGGVHAVSSFSCEVGVAEIVGLIGPNGSGKTTSFGMIAGGVRPDGGRVTFDGSDITGHRSFKIARRGLVRTFQLTRMFADLSVYENVVVGQASTDAGATARALRLVELVGLESKIADPAGSLSFGQQRLLELIRGACLGPKLFLLDEPFAGINPTMEEKLLVLIRYLRDEAGMSFLIVDHEMRLIMELCQHIYVMDRGRNLTDGSPSVVRSDAATLDAYFGKGYVAGARGT